MRLERRRRVRSYFTEILKIMNGKYDLNRERFQLEEGGERGHDRKLFKRIFRLDIRKYAVCNRVIDNWNSLTAGCVCCDTINTFKQHLSPELESGAVSSHLRIEIVGNMAKACAYSCQHYL